MRSARRPALALFLILLLSSPSIAGCAGTPPPAILAALKCAPLVPNSYRSPVPGVSPLPTGSTIGDLAIALDGQTERLSRANGRTADVIAMVDACDARSAEVMDALQPKKRFIWF